MGPMSPEQLRRRLEALNRSPLPAAGRGTRPSPGPDGHHAPADIDRAAVRLERLIDGRELQTGSGRCYRILRPLCRHWQFDPQLGDKLAAALTDAARRPDTLDRDLAPLAGTGLSRLLFVDLETCGFAGTPVFLVGCLRYTRGDLQAEQLLARTYEEESAIVARLAELIRRCPLLTTFNGKSFDWPFARDRAAVARVELPQPQVHCDLLHVARRRYRQVLPDCKLQTLELYVCKRRRAGDIPGSEIPAAYHDFVRTGDARLLRQIVHHNWLDLVTMAELVIDLLQAGGQR